METRIELWERKRITFLKWYILGFVTFMVLMLVRHFFRLGNLNQQPIGGVVLGGLVASLAVQVFFLIRSALLERDHRQEPEALAAMNDELVQAIFRESWIAAYLGCAGMTVFFAVSWFFYPLCDPVTISLSSIAMGAGAHRIYFYVRYRNL